jgi:hypothetical protein
MTNPPQFHRGSPNHYYTNDGVFTAFRRTGPWVIETKSGEIVVSADTYGKLLEEFAKWWVWNGWDKRFKPMGRF